MFRKRKTAVVRNSELLENIKRDIKNKLNEKGVVISGINMKMNPKNISLSIQIKYLPPKTHQLI